jgi:hypothetical protein
VSATDPRTLPGDVAGPGGPHDRYGVVADLSNAVLLGNCSVMVLEEVGVIAMLLSGGVYSTTDRARVLFLLNTDGAAGIITQLLGLMGRAGIDNEAFLADLDTRMAELRAAGNLSPKASS